MQLFHISASLSVTFDETDLVSATGLASVMALAVAVKTRLGDLTDRRLRVPGYFGANAGLKVTGLVTEMLVGADPIDGMAILHHGEMKKLFVGAFLVFVEDCVGVLDRPSLVLGDDGVGGPDSRVHPHGHGHVRTVAGRRLSGRIPVIGGIGTEERPRSGVG